jgi:energy-coupling factor transporter ATP-binding protein EcfA2
MAQKRPPKEKIELNEEFEAALDALEHGHGHVFLTGRAGTGKSTLLRHWRRITQRKMVVLAPTGIAALNVHGQTIHSFFGFSPAETTGAVRRWVKKLPDDDKYRQLDTIVIDEISMVRADLLDCMDVFLRFMGPHAGRPFGGVRLVMFGDLFQLPPVVTRQQREVLSMTYPTPYFFSALAFSGIAAAPVETIPLTKVYRQQDRDFIDLLDAVRTGRAGQRHFSRLSERRDRFFEPPPGEFWVNLTTTNAKAREINETKLAELKTEEHVFKAETKGEIPAGMSFPTEKDLLLKAGAQVMFVANDPSKRWVNGTVGRVEGFSQDEDGHDTVVVELSDEETVEVGSHTWEMYEWEFDPDSGQMGTESVGSFTQYPLRLAWAITIHKSQGQTFDRMILDLERGTFASGQLYVALSRCRTMEGLVLRQAVTRRHMLVDPQILEFVGEERPDIGEVQSGREVVSVLRAAFEDRLAVRIKYHRPPGEPNWRTVTPLEVGELSYNQRGFNGLRAFCHDRQAERMFRLDRIVAVEIPGEDGQ